MKEISTKFPFLSFQSINLFIAKGSFVKTEVNDDGTLREYIFYQTEYSNIFYLCTFLFSLLHCQCKFHRLWNTLYNQLRVSLFPRTYKPIDENERELGLNAADSKSTERLTEIQSPTSLNVFNFLYKFNEYQTSPLLNSELCLILNRLLLLPTINIADASQRRD